jgi:RNA polymerase sigma-70 factor, ECF subfamily
MDERRLPPGAPTRDLAGPIGASDGDAAQRSLAADLARDLDASFDRFVERFEDRLFGFVLTLTGNRSEAEEIAQDAFVSAYQALQKYEPDRRRFLSLRAWLFTIALNKVRNRARRPAPVALDNGFVLAADAADGPEARAEQNEAVAVVREALDTLAPRYRMPVMLRHIEGLSYDEIANVLEQPVGTAKANVHRGLALLRSSPKIGALS